jgi:hypothetical protein
LPCVLGKPGSRLKPLLQRKGAHFSESISGEMT